MAMNRGGAIAYSSVPQDEGGASIITRPPGNSRSYLSCQLITIVISLAVVAAISLAAILPLILKDRAVANGRNELLVQPIASKTTPLPEGNIYTEQQPSGSTDSLAGYTKNKSLSDGQTSVAQSSTSNIGDSVPEKSTVKPAIPTTTTTESTPATTTTTTTTTENTIAITPKKTEVPSTTVAKPTAEGNPGTTAISNMENEGQGTAGETQVVVQ